MSKKAKPVHPHPDLVKNLVENKIQVYARQDGPDILLWCNYGEHTKQKNGQGFEVWGRAQNYVDLISRTVFAFYPAAEVTSQSGNAHIVYKLNP